MSRTKAVRLLKCPLVLLTRGLTTRASVFCWREEYVLAVHLRWVEDAPRAETGIGFGCNHTCPLLSPTAMPLRSVLVEAISSIVGGGVVDGKIWKSSREKSSICLGRCGSVDHVLDWCKRISMFQLLRDIDNKTATKWLFALGNFHRMYPIRIWKNVLSSILCCWCLNWRWNQCGLQLGLMVSGNNQGFTFEVFHHAGSYFLVFFLCFIFSLLKGWVLATRY